MTGYAERLIVHDQPNIPPRGCSPRFSSQSLAEPAPARSIKTHRSATA